MPSAAVPPSAVSNAVRLRDSIEAILASLADRSRTERLQEDSSGASADAAYRRYTRMSSTGAT